MSTDGSPTTRLRTTALVWIDALAYSVLVALATVSGAVVAGIVSGGGFVRVKVLLFLAGFALMGYATIRLWPSSPSDLEDRSGVGDSVSAVADETRFQSFVQAVPPMRWLRPPPPARRMTPAGKLFLGSLFVLLASFLMEIVFGIA